MALVKTILGSGNAGQSAQAIVGFVSLAQTASGASQGSQTLPTAIVEYTTSTSNYGPTLSATAAPGDTVVIINGSANTIKVWPASGYKIDGGTTDAAVTQATLVTKEYLSLGNGNWVIVQ